MSREPQPPRTARHLLERALPRDVRDEIVGDLTEVFRDRCATRGRIRATCWYWREVLAFAVRFTAERVRDRPDTPGITPPRRRPVAGLVAALQQDLGLALRGIGREPGFALAVVLTLTLGIGANHVMFRVIDRVLLRPPEHVVDADRVVRVFERSVLSRQGAVDFKQATSYPNFRDLGEAHALAQTAAYAFGNPVVGEGDAAETVLSQWATAGLFPLLGVNATLGRFFSSADDHVGADRTAVLSWAYWQRRFGGDVSVIGRTLRIGDHRHTVIGVAPRGFTGPSLEPVQVWLPLHPTADAESGEGWTTARVWNWIHIVARLAPNATRELAADEATRILAGHRRDDPTRNRSVVLTSLIAADEPEVPAWASVARWLAGVSVLVWIIAAANVANLLLVREIRRRRETAVRLALGVSRIRVLGQFLTEALVLALPAAAVAAIVAGWGGQWVATMLLPGFSFEPVGVGVGDGARILGFTLATGLVTALIAGLGPALQAGRCDMAAELKAGGRAGHGRSRVQDALLVLQGAFSVVMLIGAGLFVRSMHSVESVDRIGLDPDPVTLAQLSFEPGSIDRAETAAVFRAALDRVARMPGVDAVAAATLAPFNGGRGVALRLAGGEPLPDPPGRTVGPDQVHVSQDFFRTVGMRIVRGRSFVAADDRLAAERVALVSRSMAEHYWPTRDAVGECIRVEREEACTRIVGVASDIRWHGPGWKPPLVLYLPLGQRDATPRDLLVREAEGAEIGAATLRKELRAVSPRIRFVGVRPLAALVAGHTAPWRLGATMCLLFGGLALLVAAVGLYSLLAFKIAQRRREIAVRGALGATRLRIVGLVLGDGGRLVAAGVVCGLAIAALAGRRIEPLLHDVSGRDPLVYGVVTATLIAVGLLASTLPACRAARVDAARVLRGD